MFQLSTSSLRNLLEKANELREKRPSGGSFTVNSTDDSIHSNGNITITGGNFEITSGDDGMHADTTLTIEDGAITESDQAVRAGEGAHLRPYAGGRGCRRRAPQTSGVPPEANRPQTAGSADRRRKPATRFPCALAKAISHPPSGNLTPQYSNLRIRDIKTLAYGDSDS